MEKEEWLKQFDETKDKFKWFFVERQREPHWNWLLKERERSDVTGMKDIMTHVWYCLPDDEFNIIENPPGWSEFLNLLDE